MAQKADIVKLQETHTYTVKKIYWKEEESQIIIYKLQ